MGDQSEVNRDPINQSRSRLTDKLEALEAHVSGTVDSTKAALGSTVGTVKETMESVSEALDLRAHMERHPWLILGGSVAVGMLAARLFKGSSILENVAAALHAQPNADSSRASLNAPRPQATSDSWLDGQVKQLKTLALAALTNYVQEVTTHGLSTGVKPATQGGVNNGNLPGGSPLAAKANSETGDARIEKNSLAPANS